MPDLAARYQVAQRSIAGHDRKEARRRVAEKALWVAARRFQRTIFRALDYLPPGEISFADYGRAILASDEASHPRSGRQRDWLRSEFVRRKIVDEPEDLEVRTNYDEPAVASLNLADLVESDWTAYSFANEHRDLLGIPRAIPFLVHPRLTVEKLYYHRDGARTVKECLLKVSWTESEPSRLGGPFPRRRRIARGTTLAIDWETKKVRARLTSESSPRQRQDRDLHLRRLHDRGIIRLGTAAADSMERLRRKSIYGQIRGGVLMLKGLARTLHITNEEEV
jgi:hypothetical protein